MALEFVRVARIGEIIADASAITNRKRANQICFNRQYYKVLLDIDADEIIKDVDWSPKFSLKPFQEDGIESLWLIFTPNVEGPRFYSRRRWKAVKNIIETFFITERENIFDESEQNDDVDDADVQPCSSVDAQQPCSSAEAQTNQQNGESSTNANRDVDGAPFFGYLFDENSSGAASYDSDLLPNVSIDDMYQQLREEHFLHDKLAVDYPDEHIQHKHLKPILKPYQISGVKWMLNRERTIDYFPTEFKAISLRWPTSINSQIAFHYNPRTFEMLTHPTGDVPIPTGGILADEMGLGKTVETLALILLNKRDIEIGNETTESNAVNGDENVASNNWPGELRCTCINNKSIAKTVECIRCSALQHRLCVSQPIDGIIPDSQYICPACWQTEPKIKAKSTFIVSPTSIKMQWMDEVINHIGDESFKVCIYDGIKKGSWISPAELATYDIVLTDYLTMQNEIFYSHVNQSTRTLRNPPRQLKYRSPLLSVSWWRVCLDEAQMVSSIVKQPAQMVAQLETVHRWGVTGTPIQRSINDLYGIVYFLECSPYDEQDKWDELANEFIYNGNVKPIISLLRRIMWRTCKSKFIMDQVNIPEQTEIVHDIELSDLENFHYNKEHAECFTSFVMNTRKVGKNMKLSTMNPHILNLVMEPLRKLRQDCSVPCLFVKTMKTSKKRTMKPDELLAHLMGVNEIDAKAQLRTIGSSLNGLAALHVIKNNPIEAAKTYKKVLQWAKDYNDKISVDSLLQIHALHNLMLIDHTLDAEDRKQYEKELNKFEAKYLEKNVQLVANFQLEKDKWAQKIEQTEEKFIKNGYQWWIDALANERYTGSTDLLNKIQAEIINQYSLMDQNFQSTDGISFLLTLWLDKVFEERENVQKEFEKLQFYIDNFKPIAEIDSANRDKMQKFLTDAYECHLNLKKNKEDEEEKQPPKKRKKKADKMLCKMCLAKLQLETYECVIFDKRFVQHANDDTEITQGTWKMSHQEAIIKTIFQYVRGTDAEAKEDGKTLIKMLDAMKSEFKEYSQLWVEVNYTVSAYDEIKMCKSRLQAVDPTELEDNSVLQSNSTISIHEVDDTMVEMQQQLRQAELAFVRKLGQLKYLTHLKKNNVIENCPICQTQPTEKYAVLECGHHVCIECFQSWMRTVASKFNCSVCRHEQYRSNVYYVSLVPEQRLTDSSTKVDRIVRTIVELKREDPTVKIVIFSHWQNILGVVAKELIKSDINIRSELYKFHQTIKEFKDPNLNVTCLLLPLSYGSKGLNLIEATHVFLVEPILNPGEELQAIGRIHRIGQTKKTYVHRFIVKRTIEETIYKATSTDKNGFWSSQKCTVENLMELFTSTERAGI